MARKPGLGYDRSTDPYGTLALLDQLDREEEERKWRQERLNEQTARASQDIARNAREFLEERKAIEQPYDRQRERATQFGPFENWRERDAEFGLYPQNFRGNTPAREAGVQANAGKKGLTPYQVYMQAQMASAPAAPTVPETRSNAELRNEARSLSAASRVARLESNRQGNQLLQNPGQMYDRQFTSNLRDLDNTARSLGEKAKSAKAYADAVAAERVVQDVWANYAHFRDNPDFAKNSKPDPKVENRVYYSMAHPQEAIEENGAAVNAAAYADDDDKAMYFYLWNTYGHQAADTFYNDYVKNKASAAKAADVQRRATQEGYDNGFKASLKSIGTNLISGVGLVDMFFQNIARDFGITNPNRALNYNSLAQMPSLVTDSIREGVMKNLNGQKVDDDTVDAAAGTAAWIYQLGMSMADSSVGMLLNLIGVPQVATLALMGTAAGTRAIRDARNRGASDGEALAFGWASAIAEAAFEKLSLDIGIDNIMKQFNGTKTTGRALMDLVGVKDRFGLASWLFTQLITGGVEASEEGLTNVANALADRIIMGDNSEFEQRRRALLEQGVSNEEATKAAWRAWLSELGGDVLGGFISGGVMGGVQQVGGLTAGVVSGVRQTAAEVQSGLARADIQNWVNANQQEQRLRQQYEQQNAPQVPEKLTVPSQQVQSARQADPMGYAMDKAVRGETVTKSDARAIIENPQALQALRDSGVLPGEVKNDSEGRQKVVDAVNTLAEQNRIETANNQQVNEETPQMPVQNPQENQQITDEAPQERTTPPMPQQAAQEQQNKATTPPLPQSAQRAAETQQNNDLRIATEDNVRTDGVTGALRDVNPGIVEAMSEDTTIRDAVNAVNAEVQKGTISAEAGAQFLDTMWQAGSDNESRQVYLRSIYDTSTGELTPQALSAARRIDARNAGQTLRLSDNATAERQAPLTVGPTNDNVNRQEVNNGQKQAETAAASEFRIRARENAAGRQALGGGEWTTGVARLLEAARNSRTNRNLQQRADAAARLQDQAEARRLVKQSGQDLGIEDTSDAKTVTVLDNDMLGREWEQMVSYYASKGVKLQAMIGQIETKDLRANGKPVTVRAWVSGDGKNIIVQADHPTLSWQQLLAHEELHRRIKENSAFKKAAQDALLADNSLKPYLSQIIDRYTEAYRAVKPNITDDEVIEELLADYRAGFDMLDPLGTLAGVRKATKAASRDIRALERKGVAPTESNAEEQVRGSASIEIGNNEEGDKNGERPRDVSAISETVQKGANASKGGRENAADRRRSGEAGTLGYGGAREYGSYERSEQEQIDKFLNGIIENSAIAAREVSGQSKPEMHLSIYEMMQEESGFIERLIKENDGIREIISDLEDYLEGLGVGRTTEINDIRKSYTTEMVEKYTKLAEQYFGVTQDFDKAGYIDTDGNLLDFNKGTRDAINHREVYKVLDFLHEVVGRNDGMYEFLNMGNIRVTENGLELSKKPNSQQRKAIRDYVEHNYDGFQVDITGEDGNNLANQEYLNPNAQKVLSDIDTFFRDGVYPEQSDVSKYHSSFSREIRPEVVDRLDKQLRDGDYVIVYHSMYQDKDGNLYSPMAGKKKVGNKWVMTDPYDLNAWYKSDIPENIADLIENGSVKLKDNGKWSFTLKKPDAKTGDVPAALNPWNHASTDALNDQFTSAYERENDEGELVTVECVIPLSEVDPSVAVDPVTGKVETKPYEEKGMVTDREVVAKPDSQNKRLKVPTTIPAGTTIEAKDSVGLKMWKAGPVHGQISGKRPVYLSRWIRNTRVLSTEETAKMIAKTLKDEGFNGTIPGNVVGLKLRHALEAEGVKFGKPQSSVSKGYYSYMADNGYTRAQAEGARIGGKASTEIETAINQSMTMEQARNMIQRAFVLAEIKEWYDGKYKNGDEWLQGEGAEDVAMIVDNEETLQHLYLDKIPGVINGDFYAEDIIEAYKNGTLTGKEKKPTEKADLSNSKTVSDSRFYAPKQIENAKELFEKASQRMTKSNEKEVIAARAAILLYAHNKGAAETLGLTDAELNKRLRSWSNYSAKAREVSQRINAGVTESNRWTGIENSSYAMKATVTQDEVANVVGKIEGDGDGYQNKYIARTVLALDTHIDWSWLNFKFDTPAGVNAHKSANESRCNGYYTSSNRQIHVKRDAPNTVAHEMGHALDDQWGREVGVGGFLSQSSRNSARISDEVRPWFDRFHEFCDTLADSSDIRSSYSGDIKETFARFIDRFVGWTEMLATGYTPQDRGWYNDKFTTAQFVQFARLLQEKAALDANGATRNQVLSDEAGKASTEIDTEYMAAAESGDMETAQKMVDEAAKKAGFVTAAYHGTDYYKEIRVFKGGKSGYLGPGIYLTPVRGIAQRYADKSGGNGTVYNVFTKIKNPFVVTEAVPAKEILREITGSDKVFDRRMAKEGWESRVLTKADMKKLQDLGYDGVIWRYGTSPEEYLVFDSNQIKSADPVTYDDNGNIIPLSERFNPENNDIRYSVEIDPDVAKQFSMEGIEERQVQSLLRENEELKKKLKEAKAQIKTSDRTQPREEDVRRMARDILKAYSSKADGVNESLRELAHTIMSNDTRWTDVRDQAVRLAGKILENSSVLVGDDAELNREIRNAIRKEKIAYTNNGNIADYGQWRKDNFGKLKIAKDGVPVETRWEELQNAYGKGYFPDDIKNPADQVVYLSELFDRLQDVYENPYNQNMAEATEFLANDIIDRVISGELRQAPTTYADRAETRIARETLRGELRAQKIMERLEAERERRNEKIAELKEHYKDKEAKGKENRKARDMRAKIINHAKQMTTELLKPTDKKHVPESLRKSVAAVLSAIDIGSGYDMTTGQDGKTLRVGRGTEGAEQTKRTKAFMELREALLKEADGLVLDPELLGTVEEPGSLTRLVTELADVPIANMNTEQLQVVYDALRGVEGAVRSANRMLSSARWAAVGEAADAIRSENSSKGPVLQLAGAAGRAQDLTRLDMLTPEGYFHRLGKSGQAVFKMLRGAQDQFITNMTKATNDTQKIVGDTDVGALEKEKHTVTMGGEKVTMTTAQIMELYCLMQRDQGLQHITTGGIMVEPVRQGIKQTTQAEPLHPSMEELLDAVRLLTPEEVRLADAMQDYLSKDMAELGNEATLAVYGYKKFGQESKYWKIRSNKNEIQQSIEKETQTTSVANRGFTKAVNPQANTSVKIGSIFDTYSQSVNDMATYAAWLAVGEDVNRIRNYVFRDGEGQRTGTVKGILDRVIGSGGANYLQRLLADIANGAGMDDAGLTSGFVGAYKAAAIGANIRVIIQQPTAILRAAEMIDPKYLSAGLKNPMKSFERAKEYSPIAQWKDWGYFDINTGRKMKDVLFENSSKLEKVRQVSMAMAGKADSFAWGQLWGAVEAETKAKTDLKPGTKEFYEACAERFNDIIDHTQVVDGILQRSQIMRSKNAITRMAVSFMSEPTKQYNQFMSAVYDYRHSGDKKQAKQMLARTTFSMLAAGVMNVLAQSIVDALRNGDRERKYWEKLLQAFLGYNPDDDTFGEKFKTFAFSNMGELITPATYLPYAKDIMSIIQGYSVERMDMDGLSDTITAITRLAKALNGEGKQTVGYSLGKAVEQGAKLLGLSAYNVDRDLTALITTIANDADMPVLQYYLNRYRYRPGDNLSKELKGILWDARQKNDGSYDIIVEHLLKDGYTQKKIDVAMLSRSADETGLTAAIKAADAAGNANKSYDTEEILAGFRAVNLPEEEAEPLLEWELSEKQWSRYQVMKEARIEYDERMDIMEKYQQLSGDDDSKSGEKALEFAHYVDRLDLTDNQKATVKEQFSFWSQIKAETTQYDKLTGAGLSSEEAYTLASEFKELEPAEGKAQVSDMQRYRTISKDKSLSEKEKLSAIGSLMGTELVTKSGEPTQWARLNTAVNSGMSVDQALDLMQDGLLDDYERWTDSDAKKAGVGWEVYSEYKARTSEMKADKDANGKTINGSKKEKVVSYISGLKISTAQKDALYYDAGYSESGLKDTPWHSGGGKGSGSYAPARIPTLRLPDMPKAEKPSSGLRLPATNAAPRQSSGLRLK